MKLLISYLTNKNETGIGKIEMMNISCKNIIFQFVQLIYNKQIQ